MNIDSIKNGYVIDHIQPGKALEIYDYLKLGDLDCSVAIIRNAKSDKMGKKDIIKIDKKLDLDINVLGYIDNNITINVIENDITRNSKIVEESKENLYEISKEVADYLESQNVVYAEVRFAPMFHTKEGLSYNEIVEAVRDGLRSNPNVKTNLILCSTKYSIKSHLAITSSMLNAATTSFV